MQHKDFQKRIFDKYGNKINILNKYKNLKTKIKFTYNCDIHGEIKNEYSASTMLYSKTFQPCKLCTKQKISQNTIEDLSGLIFNHWTVLSYSKNSKWKCRCQCGTIKEISGQSLKAGTSKSCGCKSYFELIGKKIGRLTVVKYYDTKNGSKRMLCECDCGNECIINLSHLKKKNPTKSCGCLSEERLQYVKTNGLKNMQGKKYGKWTVLKYNGESKWLCRCECGNERLVQTSSLTSGQSTSCGKCFENKVNYDFFNKINTCEKAYILGILYADGYNNEDKKTVRLDLQEEDVDILIKIKKIMKFEGNIKYYQNKNKIFTINGSEKEYKCKPTARLLIHNTKISEQLALKGCTNNKTYTAQFPNKEVLPTELYKDFIRGLIDGDGSISCWVDNKKTGHKKFSLSLTGTTEIIDSVNNIIIEKFNCKPDIRSRYKERDNNNVTLSICGNRIIENILDWLYKDSNIYLDRKYKKYIELKNMNNITTYNFKNSYCMTPVIQLDEDMEIVNKFKSISATQKLGFTPSGISRACKKYDHKYKNYLWFYQEDYEMLLKEA